MRYLQTFSTSGAVQEALDAELLGKPYCALVENNLDWNTLSPSVAELIGEWNPKPEESDSDFDFYILDDTTSLWQGGESVSDFHIIAEIDGFNENNVPVTWQLVIYYDETINNWALGAYYSNDLETAIGEELNGGPGEMVSLKLETGEASDSAYLGFNWNESTKHLNIFATNGSQTLSPQNTTLFDVYA